MDNKLFVEQLKTKIISIIQEGLINETPSSRLTNTEIDDLVAELKNWNIIFQQYPINFV